MSNEQSPAAEAKTSGCTTCFILGIALIGMSIVLGSILLSVFFDGWEFPDLQKQSAALGKTLSDVDLAPITLNEKPVSREDLSDKVVLINFWATWCGPCRSELPEIAEIGENFEDDSDFLLLPVSCGDDDPVQLSTDSVVLLREMNLEMPCYADPGGTTRRAFARAAGSDGMSLPTTLVLDRKGVIRGVWIGYSRGGDKKMVRLISALLAENP